MTRSERLGWIAIGLQIASLTLIGVGLWANW